MLALVTTFRNERHLLPDQLRVHHAFGVERCYAYDDGSEDGTAEALAALDFVEVIDAAGDRSDMVTARQCRNVEDAMARARAAGMRWLLSVDADEIALPARRRAAPGGLARLLAAQPPAVDAVRFRVLECLQEFEAGRDPFRRLLRFKDARRRVPRRWADPVTGRVDVDDWIYGHREGKWAIRLDAGEVRPHGVHAFVAADGTPLGVTKAGWLLHYVFYDPSDFRHRAANFRGAPTHWLHGTVDPPRVTAWRRLADTPGVVLDDYFESWVRFSPRDARRLARRRPPWRRAPVVRVPAVAALLKRLGPAPGGAGSPPDAPPRSPAS